MTIFDILKDIIKDKTGKCSEHIKFESTFNVFILARYLSMKKEYMPYAQWLSRYGNHVGKLGSYKFLVKNVPKSYNSYIPYIKSKKDKEEPIIDDVSNDF